MDANFVNPFIEATLNILETTASTHAKAKKPYIKENLIAQGDVSGFIELTGDFKGTVAVSFTKYGILGIVSNMFGEEMKEINDDIQDAVGEISNMICGHVATKFTEFGKSMSVKPASVLMGKNHTIDHLHKRPVVALPFKTDKGEFTIEVCFDE